VDLWDYQAFHSQQKRRRRRKEEEKGREEKRAERKTQHPTISFSQEPRKTRGKYPNVYFLYE